VQLSDPESDAQKACAILVRFADDTVQWIGISKDPITDSGKKSLEGVVTTVRSKMTGEHMPARLDLGPLNEGFEDLLFTTYHLGQLYNETVMSEIRGLLAANASQPNQRTSLRTVQLTRCQCSKSLLDTTNSTLAK
jgi:nicotinic acid phosphoribosyltransferase